MLDLYFHSLHITRFLLNTRLPLLNTHAVPGLAKLTLYFSLRNLSTLEDPSVYNYFYFFRFFLGRKAYVTAYKTFYSLRVTYYSFDICITLNKKKAFFPIAFYVNDVHRFLSLRGAKSFFTSPLCYTIRINDMNLFTERKTNLGLYNLKHSLNYRFFLCNGDFLSSQIFLDSLKLLLF